jgi:hypothetical protein
MGFTFREQRKKKAGISNGMIVAGRLVGSPRRFGEPVQNGEGKHIPRDHGLCFRTRASLSLRLKFILLKYLVFLYVSKKQLQEYVNPTGIV